MEKTMIKIWLDDERPAPNDTFIVCKNIWEFCQALESADQTDQMIEHIDYDFYLDSRGHGATGMDAVLETITMDRYGWDKSRLSKNFTFGTHSSDEFRNAQMTETLNAYLAKKKIS